MRVAYISGNTYKYQNTYKYLAQSEALFNRAIILGYAVPDEYKKREIDKLIRSLVFSGIWEKLSSFFQFAYNDTEMTNFSKINWVRPDNEITVYGSPTFTLKGWLGNGIDGYLDTNILLNNTNTGNKFLLNNAFFGGVIYQEYFGGSNNASICSSKLQSFNWINQEFNTFSKINTINSTAAPINYGGTGFLGISRYDETNVKGFNKEVVITTTATSTDYAETNHCWLKRQSLYGTMGISTAITGLSLTYDQTQKFRELYNNYLNNIGLTQFA